MTSATIKLFLPRGRAYGLPRFPIGAARPLPLRAPRSTTFWPGKSLTRPVSTSSLEMTLLPTHPGPTSARLKSFASGSSKQDEGVLDLGYRLHQQG